MADEKESPELSDEVLEDVSGGHDDENNTFNNNIKPAAT